MAARRARAKMMRMDQKQQQQKLQWQLLLRCRRWWYWGCGRYGCRSWGLVFDGLAVAAAVVVATAGTAAPPLVVGLEDG